MFEKNMSTGINDFLSNKFHKPNVFEFLKFFHESKQLPLNYRLISRPNLKNSYVGAK